MGRNSVLIIDDDESLRRVTQVQLEQAGYDVSVAADGRQGLELLQRSPYDLVITDFKMPGLSGLDVLKQVRAECPETLVVLVTAFGTVESAVEAVKTGNTGPREKYCPRSSPANPDSSLR